MPLTKSKLTTTSQRMNLAEIRTKCWQTFLDSRGLEHLLTNRALRSTLALGTEMWLARWGNQNLQKDITPRTLATWATQARFPSQTTHPSLTDSRSPRKKPSQWSSCQINSKCPRAMEIQEMEVSVQVPQRHIRKRVYRGLGPITTLWLIKLNSRMERIGPLTKKANPSWWMTVQLINLSPVSSQ